jgi:RHS repeat-associated protein
VTKTAAGTTTIYLEGLWEEVVGGAQQAYYVVGGQPVAVRTASGVTYLHGDHLGSVGLATDATGNEVSRQAFDPWGKARSGSIPQTSRNFTGQVLDGTGLLYYHARYYDPAIGRFLSADTIVPGAGALTVAPSDATAAAAWAASGGEPANPQELNRYSYALNNPARFTDPTGHCIFLAGADALLCYGVVVLIGAAAYVAVDAGARYAREHPVNLCDYTNCTSEGSPPKNVPASSDTGGNTGTPSGPPDPNGEDEPPASSTKRRSQHSEARAAQGRRTGPAFRDAHNASRSRVAWDNETGRFVVRGPDGRYHVFETDGEHVTTVNYTAKTWYNRHASGRWTDLTDEQWEQFQRAYQSTGK